MYIHMLPEKKEEWGQLQKSQTWEGGIEKVTVSI